MASLQSSSLKLQTPSYYCGSAKPRSIYTTSVIKSTLQFPNLNSPDHSIKLPLNPTILSSLKTTFNNIKPTHQILETKPGNPDHAHLHGFDHEHHDVITSKMYAVLEAVSDRIEMHRNICDQRNNWNTLLLNSINMITLTATLTSCISSAVATSHITDGSNMSTLLAMKLFSGLLFMTAAGLLSIMNLIQPSQLVEEQRNAVRLFKNLKTHLEINLISRNGNSIKEDEVVEAVDQVLAIDRAYPLPLLAGAMLNKFPEKFEPAQWWPAAVISNNNHSNEAAAGWSEGLEEDLKEVVEVIKGKDIEDYVRLGGKALKLSKGLALAGPILTGLAAVGSLSVGEGRGWAVVMAAVCGSVACGVNALEHGGQVGMVLEMYRNCAGSFKLMEETMKRRKEMNGEVFELKMGLSLGRSVEELRDLAARSRRGLRDEFASKLY